MYLFTPAAGEDLFCAFLRPQQARFFSKKLRPQQARFFWDLATPAAGEVFFCTFLRPQQARFFCTFLRPQQASFFFNFFTLAAGEFFLSFSSPSHPKKMGWGFGPTLSIRKKYQSQPAKINGQALNIEEES